MAHIVLLLVGRQPGQGSRIKLRVRAPTHAASSRPLAPGVRKPRWGPASNASFPSLTARASNARACPCPP
eukprot:3404621-Rhodomonas_salina.3